MIIIQKLFLLHYRKNNRFYKNLNNSLVEIGNPGASGSLFWLTHDDEFIIKTLQTKEAEFLQRLLPGYYMNVQQNPRTLLPKFYGKEAQLKNT